MTFVLSGCLRVFSQGVAVNNSNATADISAILDISSTSKGLLIPRMNTLERNAIASPARGLLVYDTDTQSFWYWTGLAWKEVLFSGAAITPTGPALGDLYGTFPAPNVGKIQNLDVAFGVPFDKQVMKWDMLNSRWQGQNDSLFLPYNVASANTTKLFGITNNNTTGGATAVYGKSGAGSGIIPAVSVGVWGDNANGAGILGTSNNGTAVYGYSVNNYGIYGYTGANNYAGVFGSCNSLSGTGVTGDAYGGGTGIYGKANGTTGKAGYFRNVNISNTDTGLVVIHDGLGKTVTISATNASQNLGVLSINNAGVGQIINLSNSNTSNNAHMFFANQTGTGVGYYLSVANTLNNSPGILVEHSGTGSGIESYGFKGKAGLFQIPAASNASTALDASTIGTGKAANLSISNSGNSSPAVTISTNGTGRGLQSIISNASNLAAAVYGSSSGNKGVEGIAQVNGVIGQSTGLTGGIGVLGQSSLNSNDGIGVKGVSYSSLLTRGSVTGENLADGIGVYGSSLGNAGNGIGVYGTTSATGGAGVKGSASLVNADGVYGEHAGGGNGVFGNSFGANSVGVRGQANSTGSYGIGVVGNNLGDGDGVRGFAGNGGNGVSGFDNSQGAGRAGYFEIFHASNTSEAVKILQGGLGTSLYINNTNSSNTGTMVRFRKSGTGDYIVFEDGAGVNKIRFDNAGKGFFNGGTQTGGADMAEIFDVADDIRNYEPGDVLIISTDKDRTVVKSNGAYSNLVAGVYATKPGMLMTEENIDADLSGKVPMGVVGVIPTKVCLEGGEIRRGDMLVTSSQPGVAMKADPEKLKTGQVIGKALENYTEPGTGKIKVLVNVK